MAVSYPSFLASIYALLTPSQRVRAVVVFALMVAGMVLETLGVGLVIPALALLLEDNPAARYPALTPLLQLLGDARQDQLVMTGMAVLLAVYVVKALFLGFLAWYQNRFAFSVQEHTSLRLVDTYLHQPYTFHLQRNSPQLIRNAVNEANKLWFLVLNPIFVVFSEGLVLVGITCLLFALQPIGALILVLVLGLGGLGSHYFTRKRLLHLGYERQRLDGLRIQQVQEGLGGVKEVKLLGREDGVLRKYARYNSAAARVERIQATVQILPRLWIETLAVAGLALLVLAMVAQGRQAAAIVPTLGLFAAAAFRLMPSAYRVMGAVQNLPYGLPVITALREELQLSWDATPRMSHAATTSEFAHDIRLVDVHYTYPEAATPALSGVSISVQKGESVGFVGPSGAGKSTLVDVILGLLTPTDGHVLVDGRDIQKDLLGWQRQVGYVPQNVYLSDDTLRNNVAFGLAPEEIDDDAVRRALAAAQLSAFVDELPAGLATFVGERGVRLSGGQRQRIGIARALYHDPPLLVLDEATSALDLHTEHEVMKSVAVLRDKTVLVVSHRLSTVEQCSRLYRLEHGSITTEGMPAELFPTSR